MEYSTELQNLRNRYEWLKNYYHAQIGKNELLVHEKTQLEEKLQAILDNMDTIEKVRVLLQSVSEYAREQSRLRVESLVTDCLQFIFDTNISFKIEMRESRGRPEAEFFVVSTAGGTEIKTKPQEARGGGIVDIISLALRIAMLECSSPKIEGPIILDEPVKHVSDEYILQVAEFLKQVNRMFDRQVIMVTHNKQLGKVSDRIYRVEMADGVSHAVIDS